MSNNQIAKVSYQIATYSGEIEISCDIDWESEDIISEAKKILRREAGGNLPYGYERFTIVSRE